jgi:hypothetical protein
VGKGYGRSIETRKIHERSFGPVGSARGMQHGRTDGKERKASCMAFLLCP